MAFLKKIKFWKKRKNTPTKVDACVSTETQIRTLQDTHRKEKMALMQENQKLKNDIRVQKVSFAYVQTNL